MQTGFIPIVIRSTATYTYLSTKNSQHLINLNVLWRPVNNSPLILFRIFLGLIMAVQCLYTLLNGWVEKVYVQPGYNPTFIGFDWLGFLHGSIMYYYFAVMIIIALFVSAGLWYRFSITLLAFLWTGIYFSTKSQYNNHYYLMLLLLWIMVCSPAHKRFSVDAYKNPALYSSECYQWQLWIFNFQIACVYFFAAVAKMNYDWLQAIPLRYWLPAKAHETPAGSLLNIAVLPWIIAYGGLLFDLFVIPGLLHRKTRVYFFIVSLGFHIFNGVVFKIGLFPFLALSLMIFFFPETLSERIIGKKNVTTRLCQPSSKFRQVITWALACYMLLQLMLPLRHFFISGPVNWTEEGHRMSWQMMLRSKRGNMHFVVKNTVNDSAWVVYPESFLNHTALREVSVLPDVTWQAAQKLKKIYAAQNIPVAIYYSGSVSLNFKAYQPIIDSTKDLGSVKWNYCKHNDWILLNNH